MEYYYVHEDKCISVVADSPAQASCKFMAEYGITIDNDDDMIYVEEYDSY